MMYLLEKYINDSLLFIFPQIFLYDNIDDMIYLVNADSMFTLDYVDIEKIQFSTFLEDMVKQVSNYLITISKQIILCVAMRVSYVLTEK